MSTIKFVRFAFVAATLAAGCAGAQTAPKTEDGWLETDPSHSDRQLDSLEVVMTPPAEASATPVAPAAAAAPASPSSTQQR